jgi:hypothetical protein
VSIPLPHYSCCTDEHSVQGMESSRPGNRKRSRSSGAGRGASGAPAAAHKGDAGHAAQHTARSLPVAAQSPADTSVVERPLHPPAKKLKPFSDAPVQPTLNVTRRPATRSLAQKAALLAQDSKVHNGHDAKAENNQPGLQSAFLDAGPKRTGELPLAVAVF